MNIIASIQNLRTHGAALLGNDYSPERLNALIDVCHSGFERTHGHISHDYAAHLEKINEVLGTHGVEGMLLDGSGADVSGDCSTDRVKVDIQYCNAGDTYAMTVFYYKGRLRIGDWGSIVEANCLA